MNKNLKAILIAFTLISYNTNSAQDLKQQAAKIDQQIVEKNNNIKNLKAEINAAPWYRKVDIGITKGTEIAKLAAEVTSLEITRKELLKKAETIK